MTDGDASFAKLLHRTDLPEQPFDAVIAAKGFPLGMQQHGCQHPCGLTGTVLRGKIAFQTAGGGEGDIDIETAVHI